MQLHYICVGQCEDLNIGGRGVASAIRKRAVSGPVPVLRAGLTGDEQADLSAHGGPDKAVYAYPRAHYAFWNAQRERHQVPGWETPLAPGAMGENLGLDGLDETQVWIGDLLRFADCELRVESPRNPCFKFNAVMGFNGAVKAMAESGFSGWYLSVVKLGTVTAPSEFEWIAGPRLARVSDVFARQKFRLLR